MGDLDLQGQLTNLSHPGFDLQQATVRVCGTLIPHLPSQETTATTAVDSSPTLSLRLFFAFRLRCDGGRGMHMCWANEKLWLISGLQVIMGCVDVRIRHGCCSCELVSSRYLLFLFCFILHLLSVVIPNRMTYDLGRRYQIPDTQIPKYQPL